MSETLADLREMAKKLARRNEYDDLLEPMRAVARAKGYALAVHGSRTRDFDVIAAPWTDDAVPARELAAALIEHLNGLALNVVASDPYDATRRNPKALAHGRLAWSIHVLGKDRAYGCYIDLSVMPTADRLPTAERDRLLLERDNARQSWAELDEAHKMRDAENDRLRAAAMALLEACVPHGDVQQRVNNGDVIALRDALAGKEVAR
jgi:hypothetical protein